MLTDTTPKKAPYKGVKCNSVVEMQTVVDFVHEQNAWTVDTGCGPVIELDRPFYAGCHLSEASAKSNSLQLITFSEFERDYLKKGTKFKAGDWVVMTKNYGGNLLKAGEVYQIVREQSEGMNAWVVNHQPDRPSLAPWAENIRLALPHEIPAPKPSKSILETVADQSVTTRDGVPEYVECTPVGQHHFQNKRITTGKIYAFPDGVDDFGVAYSLNSDFFKHWTKEFKPSTKEAYDAQQEKEMRAASVLPSNYYQYAFNTAEPKIKEFAAGDWVVLRGGGNGFGGDWRGVVQLLKIDEGMRPSGHISENSHFMFKASEGAWKGNYLRTNKNRIVRHATPQEIQAAGGNSGVGTAYRAMKEFIGGNPGIDIHKGNTTGPSTGCIGIDVETGPVNYKSSWYEKQVRAQEMETWQNQLLMSYPRRFGATSDLATAIGYVILSGENNFKKSSNKVNKKRNLNATVSVKLQEPMVVKATRKKSKLITL